MMRTESSTIPPSKNFFFAISDPARSTVTFPEFVRSIDMSWYNARPLLVANMSTHSSVWRGESGNGQEV